MYSGGDKGWQRNSGKTDSLDTGPRAAYDGDMYAYIEAGSGGFAESRWETVPPFDILQIFLKFCCHL